MNPEKYVPIPFLYVECLVKRNCHVGIIVLKVVIKVNVQLVKFKLLKYVLVHLHQEKHNVGCYLIKIKGFNVKKFVEKEKDVEFINVKRFVVLINLVIIKLIINVLSFVKNN